MQATALALAFAAFTVFGIQAQQAPSAAQTQAQTVPRAPYKRAQTSFPDQVQTCPEKFDDRPEVDGIYRIGRGVTPPRATYQPNAEFSDEARQLIKKQHIKGFHAVSVLAFVVDSDGNPQDICLKTPAGYGLDEQAVRALQQYRFNPATKDGAPVPVRVNIEVNFKMY